MGPFLRSEDAEEEEDEDEEARSPTLSVEERGGWALKGLLSATRTSLALIG